FFQAEDGIRDFHVTGVQTCALPILKAEEDLLEVIRDFNPDALLFLQKATERAHIDKDIEITKRIMKKADVELPLVGIITHIDERSEERRVGKEGRSRWSAEQ